MTATPFLHELVSQARVHIHNHGLAEFARHAEASAHAMNTEASTAAARRVVFEVAGLLRLFRAMVGEWRDVSRDPDGECVMAAIERRLADEERPVPADEALATAPVWQSVSDSDLFRAQLDGHVWWVRREEDADFDGEGYRTEWSFAVVRREPESAVEPAEVRR